MNEVELLQRLVAIPSLSGEESEAVSFLVQAMTAMGYAAEIDEAGNAVGIRENPDENGRITNEIMLLGHIDTVPGDIPVRIEGDLLYGRGAVDAKGPLATFVVAGSQAHLPSGTRIVVVGAVEEESTTSKGARYIAQQFTPDYCIIGEPSGWDGVTLGYKGRILIDYTRQEEMGHTAGSQTGAAEKGLNWWINLSELIAEFNEGRHKLFHQLMSSVRHIETSSNGLNNRIEMKIGIRLPPDFDVQSFQQRVVELANGASVKTYAYEPAFSSSRLSPLARVFNKVLRQEGVRPRFKLKTGTSDMNVVGPIWQCPIVAYGPGDSNLDHTPDEHIVISEYTRAALVLRTVLSEGWQ